MATIAFDGQTPSRFSSLEMDTLYTDLTLVNVSLSSLMVIEPAADTAFTQYGWLLEIDTVVGNAFNIVEVVGAFLELKHLSDGTITNAIGMHDIISSSDGVITEAIALKTQIQILAAAGTITSGYGLYGVKPVNFGGTFTHYYGLYAEEFTSGITNLHYLWFDSDGVLDIRDASSQAIIGLHNPGITKFTSGSANYERSVLQWASNILQLGAEKGGTGTLRKVRVLGAGLILDTDILPSSDPGVPGQVYRTAGALMVSL